MRPLDVMYSNQKYELKVRIDNILALKRYSLNYFCKIGCLFS